MTSFINLKQLLSLKREFSKCVIISEQEGAEIWLNGCRTEFKTPRMIDLPKNQEVMVEIKHLGHESQKVWLKSSNSQSFYYCDLKRIPLRLVHDEESDNEYFYTQNKTIDPSTTAAL